MAIDEEQAVHALTVLVRLSRREHQQGLWLLWPAALAYAPSQTRIIETRRSMSTGLVM